MLKYFATATALKIFSANAVARRAYRLLGNVVGSKQRQKRGINAEYRGRVRQILDFFETHHPLHAGEQLLEVGTGWMHWEATILRLFHDVRITLFDVWDNRQFDAYQAHCAQLPRILDEEAWLDDVRRAKAQTLLRDIVKTRSFDELYELLGFRYVMNPEGTLDVFSDCTFDVVYSWNVLEHIERRILNRVTQDCFRVLKPGGHSLHKIDMSDHLSHHDPSMSPKNYLRYSDATWQRFFQNDVQYFNRVQRPEWSSLFHAAGFETIVERPVEDEIGDLQVHPDFQSLSPADVKSIWLYAVHERPVGQAALVETT